VSGFSATVRRADGSFPAGNHQVEALVDGTTILCTFTFPLQTGRQPQCTGGLGITVLPATTCSQTTNGASTSVSCDEIPGQFVETIGLAGTPGQVHVWQTVDGTSILDAAAAPTYTEFKPNGPGCEPTCRQGTATWTLDGSAAP
jgi:hypothetical protein